MSLDAKMAYAFLLDRLPLSIRNGWVNEQGEAFVVFPRSALSKTLGISEKRVSAAIRQLAKKGLLREERRGFGKPNRIYLAEMDVARMSGTWSGGGTADGKGADSACC
jgi:DNA-binding MarR family transcriptional regulator